MMSRGRLVALILLLQLLLLNKMIWVCLRAVIVVASCCTVYDLRLLLHLLI
jgi:hypothetical protein